MTEKNSTYPTGLFPLPPITVVVGHYGVGKTNFSLNLAFDSVRNGKQVTLVDLDIVNPYFRSSDYTGQLEEAGIRLVSPVFAGSTLDVPSLSGAIYPVIEAADEHRIVILDVGGDDAGATSLGRFSKAIAARDYRMMYVVNAYRNLTQSPEEAATVLREIERKAGLKASGIVNNSHLQAETAAETVARSLDFAEKTAESVGLPLICTTVPETILGTDEEPRRAEGTEPLRRAEGTEPRTSPLLSMHASQNFYVVQIYVRTPWER